MSVSRKWSAGLSRAVRQRVRFFLTGLCIGVVLNTLVQTNVAWAQDWCANPPAAAAKGGFTVSAQKGCAPFTVTVKNTTNSPDNLFLYVYDYQGGDPVASKSGVADITHVYTRPGKYKILQIGNVNTGSVACQEIEVVDAIPPNFAAYSCADMKVIVKITRDAVAEPYDDFKIDWNDGSPIETVSKVGEEDILATHTYQNKRAYQIKVSGNYQGINCGGGSFQQVTPLLSTEFTNPVITKLTTTGTNVTLQVQAGAQQAVTLYQKDSSGAYVARAISRIGNGSLVATDITTHPTCFKVVSQNACGEKFESEEVCSIGVRVEAREKENEVIWNAPGNPTNFQQYTVTKNNGVLRTFNGFTTTSVVDSDGITCNEDYCYQVTALSGSVEIVSDAVCVKAASSTPPPPFTTVQVSVNGDNRIDLRSIPPIPTSQSPSYRMIIFRQDQPGGAFVQTSMEVDRNIHQDGDVQPQQQSYCYQVVYQSACGVSSEPSKTVCTILLNSKTATTINWTGDAPFADEAIDRYIIEKVDGSGAVLEEIAVGLDTSYEPVQDDPSVLEIRFRVKAVSKSGAISYSNFYTYLFPQEQRLFVPDAFTPNGDGTNDLLEVKGSTNFQSMQLTVYNRWGEVVFRTENREGWDGTINGQPAQPGTYAYRINVVNVEGKKTEKTGSVLLIR
ncbi:gliding motility-associated C-terminal domain-containing protein [Larkinella insperata]|uniref:Gliding motility-associated C-terminal domain-containing protein n=1 Tax=Larkinella insperata TaxID=332158 RepID=A0ABW3QL52_9BACT|nr:gliding motility-associated C-terminal domain-containing protein [Larkinella insperata]